jgi:hypothetical protein
MSASSHEPVAVGKGVSKVEESLRSIEEGGGCYGCLKERLGSVNICIDIELNYNFEVFRLP